MLTPILTYGSKCWAMTTSDRSRIQAAEMRHLITMLSKTRRDKIRNENIRESVGVCPMINKIEAGQLIWLGHLERMGEQRLAKGCWEFRPDGRRPKGRPRKRY